MFLCQIPLGKSQTVSSVQITSLAALKATEAFPLIGPWGKLCNFEAPFWDWGQWWLMSRLAPGPAFFSPFRDGGWGTIVEVLLSKLFRKRVWYWRFPRKLAAPLTGFSSLIPHSQVSLCLEPAHPHQWILPRGSSLPSMPPPSLTLTPSFPFTSWPLPHACGLWAPVPANLEKRKYNTSLPAASLNWWPASPLQLTGSEWAQCTSCLHGWSWGSPGRKLTAESKARDHHVKHTGGSGLLWFHCSHFCSKPKTRAFLELGRSSLLRRKKKTLLHPTPSLKPKFLQVLNCLERGCRFRSTNESLRWP